VPSLLDPSTDVVARLRAMASEITLQVVAPTGPVDAEVARAAGVFRHVDRTCTRFDDRSDLMRANAAGDDFVRIDRVCFMALTEAYAAHQRTLGRFDPRVLDDLVRLGYRRSMTREQPHAAQDAYVARSALPPWLPRFRHATQEVAVGPDPVDLGGIGKGLAVRWASAQLRQSGLDNHLVEAGGDLYCSGAPSDGEHWSVAVEHPSRSEPAAVLGISDRAVATSSVRIRSWQVGAHPVHHLIDPTTGLPGGAGLVAVTVVDDDPATAEVWSKTLFLAGLAGVATSAAFHGVAALWIDLEGRPGWSPAMAPYLVWTAERR
jgi:FAD:protein FMN transferase